MSPASYAGAMATLLILGVTVIGVMGPTSNPAAAGNKGSLAAVVPPKATMVAARDPILQLQTPMPSQRPLLGESGRLTPANSQPARNPRYVIDARPVSYEASFRF